MDESSSLPAWPADTRRRVIGSSAPVLTRLVPSGVKELFTLVERSQTTYLVVYVVCAAFVVVVFPLLFGFS